MNLRMHLSEFLGTMFLNLAIIGAASIATDLTNDGALRLLIITIASMSVLSLSITLFQPISGAHFNPVVTLIAFVNKQMSAKDAFLFMLSQILGGIVGALISAAMFGLQLFAVSDISRDGSRFLLAEVVSTAGLLFTIMVSIYNGKPETLNRTVPLWIIGAYFFTSSTSFANPAVAIGRIFTEGIAGISPQSALSFIGAQVVGGFAGLYLAKAVKKH